MNLWLLVLQNQQKWFVELAHMDEEVETSKILYILSRFKDFHNVLIPDSTNCFLG